jgi:hypothetical protein
MTIAVLFLALFGVPSVQIEDVTIPLTNRPPNFSGAAGAYRMEVRATPTSVVVEDPVTLTVKIISLAPGPWTHPPQRDKLHLLLSEWETNFFVEPLPELDRFLAGEKTWEFTWRLMPKHEGINKVPALAFVYYHTAAKDFKAADGAQSIPLEVKPRPALLLTAPLSSPEPFQHVIEGDSLRTRSPTPQARLTTLAGGLALPPLLCFSGYFAWWWLFPDAAERLRRRRGRALKTALKQMRKLGPTGSPAQVRGVLADYLRLRLALPRGEPTPLEVRRALLLLGLKSESTKKTEALLHTCDAALFAPSTQIKAREMQTDATQLMRDLEGELCSLKSR